MNAKILFFLVLQSKNKLLHLQKLVEVNKSEKIISKHS